MKNMILEDTNYKRKQDQFILSSKSNFHFAYFQKTTITSMVSTFIYSTVFYDHDYISKVVWTVLLTFGLRLLPQIPDVLCRLPHIYFFFVLLQPCYLS